MISKKTIYGSFLYTVIGSLPFASALILLPFYSNFLSTTDFGALSVYIGFSLFVQVLSTFSIEQYVATHVHQLSDRPALLKQRMGQALTLCLAAGLFFFGVFYLFGSAVFLWFDKDGQLDFWTFGLMSVGTGIFNGYFKNYTNLLVYKKQDSEYIWSNIFNFLITIGLSLSFLYSYGDSLMGPMLGRIISGLFIFLLAFVHHFRNYRFEFDKTATIEILMFAGPMLLISIFNWSTSYVDRFLLTTQVSLAEVGVYDFATKFLLPVELLHIGLSNFIMPRIYGSWNKNFTTPDMKVSNQMLHSFLVLTVAMILLTLVVIPIGVPWIVNNSDLYAAFSLLPLISVGYLTRASYNLFSGLLMLQKAIPRIIVAFLFAALFQLGSSYFILPLYGIEGAIAIAAATKVVLVVGLYLGVRGLSAIDLRVRKFVFYPLLIAFSMIAFHFFAKEYYWWGVGTTAIFCVVVTWLIFGKELKQLALSYLPLKAR